MLAECSQKRPVMRPPLELVPTSVGCSSCQAQLALGRRPLPGQRLAGVVAPPFPSLRQAPRCRALPKQADKTAVAPKAAGGKLAAGSRPLTARLG